MNIVDELFKEEYFKDINNIGLLHLNVEFFAFYISLLKEKQNRSILIVTPNVYEASKINNSMLNYTDSLFYQMDDIVSSSVDAKSPELKLDRINTLTYMLNSKKRVVITDLNGFLKKIPSPTHFKNSIISIKKGEEINRDLLLKKLYDSGYEKEIIVTSPGKLGVRGFIIDVFPSNTENPVRIEFFGDEIESIRFFNANTQKSIEEKEQITIYPFIEEENNDFATLIDYLDNPIVIFKDYNSIETSYNMLISDIKEFNVDQTSFITNFNDIKINDVMYYLDFDSNLISKKMSKIIDFEVSSVSKLNEDIDKINHYLKNQLSQNKTIILCLSIKNKNKFLDSLTLSYVLTTMDNIYLEKLNIIDKKMNVGFIKNNYIFLTENELFKHQNENKKSKLNYNYATRIKDINKLEIGDYVVHNAHGIGIFNGIKTLNKAGFVNDYLEIMYANNDKLYIPASKMENISKYAGKDGYIPKINSLNSPSWEKTKKRVKEKIRYEAERLLKVQAKRNMQKGFAYQKDTEEQILFEQEFEYEMTRDQQIATNQIKSDMEKDKPMDRILCGDVGYGKTEVAFRAVFKAVSSFKQVMYLCPTTLLSKQQYESAIKRFQNFPVKIALLNRFVSPKKTTEILENFANGKIDFLIGTHRLLSNDVISKDLGLLIIDEEQRFGVAHKEKIKEMKSDIDVLTLTATPIPRTLQMSLLGIRDLSLIETPPKNRHSVQTYVMPEDKRIIKEIIYKELARSGQTFILYNKVLDIEEKTNEIKKLVPDARITFAHGQMSKLELEKRMEDFINYEYDCLICTTIIETGIDIPNANSLIVFNADYFGLSQLYQIRGRVGRSKRVSYAYLMYQKNKMLNDIAIKRLNVIKEFTELGSGFSIATRDLSIRGAGDILGAEQAGFIDSVGIDLYMKMLEIEVKKIKGEPILEEESNDTSDVIKVNNHIKDNYVNEQELKIEIHKLINKITSLEKLKEVKKELEDRFGTIDRDMYIYMNEELFTNLAKEKGVIEINDNNMYIEIVFDKEKSNSIDYGKLFLIISNISNKFKLEYKTDKLYIKLLKNTLSKHYLLYLNELLEKM